MKAKVLRKLVSPYPWAMPTLIAFGLLVSLCEGLGIGLLIPVFQSVLGAESSAGAGPFVGYVDRYASALNPEHRLALLFATIFVLIVLKSMITFAHTYTGEWLNGHVAHTLRVKLVKQLLDVEYTFVLRQPPGRLLDTLQHQTWRAGDVFSRLSELIITAATVFVFGVLLFLISWQVALTLGLGIFAVGFLTQVFTRRAKRLGEAAVESSQAVTDRTVALLDGMRVVHAFGQEDRELAHFTSLSDEERRRYMSTDLAAGAIQPLMEVVYLPVLGLALYVAWQSGTTLPVLLTCLVLVFRVLPKLRHFQGCRVELAGLLGAIEDISGLLQKEDKPYLSEGQVELSSLDDRIRFEDVAFDYGSRAAGTKDAGAQQRNSIPAVEGLDFEIVRGEMTAIVGGSGAGKSTVAHLLCRFGDPQTGRIVVDGRPLPDYSLASWRRALAIAGQDADLFDGTVSENIAYACANATQTEIEEAARRAEAHQFIVDLPDGYDTRVGPRGRSLSAGQRQRVGLARALLARPCLLILDEATNALDNSTAAAITKTVAELRGELTVVVIAHRLEAVRDADKIIVLSEGKLVEQGGHANLREGHGEFARLYALESKC